MALPASVSDIDFLQPQAGPFYVGSARYMVARDASTTIDVKVLKSTDGGDTWAEQDASNRPSESVLVTSVTACIDGTDIRVTHVSGSNDKYHSVFSTSSDTWTSTNTSAGLSGIGVPELVFSAGMRSDSSHIILYNDVESVMGTAYSRPMISRYDGSWTTGIDVSNAGKTEVNLQSAAAIVADQTNDRTHLFYYDATNSDLYYSTYLSGNTWGHQHTSIDSTTGTASGAFGDAVAFDQSGTTKVRCSYIDSGGISIAGFNDADSPSASVVATAINDNANPTACALAVDGTTQHLLYTVSSSANIYHSETGAGNDTWATDDTELTVGASPAVVFAANVYDSVLAYLYTDNGAEEYNERSLGGALTGALGLISYTQTRYTLTGTLNFVGTLNALSYSFTLQSIEGDLAFVGDMDAISYAQTLYNMTSIQAHVGGLDALSYTHSLPSINGVRALIGTLDALSYAQTLHDILAYAQIDGNLDAINYTHTIHNVAGVQAFQGDLDALSYVEAQYSIDAPIARIGDLDTLNYILALLDIDGSIGNFGDLDALTYVGTRPVIQGVRALIGQFDALAYVCNQQTITGVKALQGTLDVLSYAHTQYDIDGTLSEPVGPELLPQINRPGWPNKMLKL